MKRVNKIILRQAESKDLNEICKIEKRAWPSELRAPDWALEYRFKIFPEGVRVAIINNKVVGFLTCVPTHFSFSKIDYKKVMENRSPHYKPWFDFYSKNRNHPEKFNALFVSSNAVLPEYQNKGIGKKLAMSTFPLMRKWNKQKGYNLKYRFNILRMWCYKKVYEETKISPEKYLRLVKNGEMKDILSWYQKLGFKLIRVLRNYQKDKDSMNHGVFAFVKLRDNS